VIAVCDKAPAGITPLRDWNLRADQFLLSRGLCKEGDTIVIVCGRPLGRTKSVNMVAMHRVGDDDSGLRTHKE
jgi:pyruvate kinase